MKKILTVAASISLAVAGFVSISSPESASAVSPTSNLYGLNVANQSAGSGANSFVELNGKTYFVASTLARATAIWSVDGDITKAPEFVFDPFTDSTSGRIQGMWGYDKYLFFWVSNTKRWGQPVPWVYNVVTKESKQVLDSSGENLLLSQGSFTETGGVVYGSAQQGWGQGTTIVKFNTSDMTVSRLTETPFAVRDTNAGDSYLSGSAWSTAPGVIASGQYLYVLTNSSNYNRDDSKIFRYDLTNDTWSDFLDYNGTVFEHVRAAGTMTYNGETGFILSKPTIVLTQPWYENISNFESYFVRPNGTFLRLGSWISAGREAAPFNLNGELYMAENYGSQIYKIDSTTGERTNALTVMFPGLTTTPYLRSVKEVDDKLVFSMKLDTQSQQTGYLLYSWDGINAATRFTDVNPTPGQQDYDQSHSNSNSGGNYEIGAMGKYTIKVLNRDPAIGAEPYYIAQDGTVTLMSDMNKASDGSSPDSSCFISTPNGDWMTGNLPLPGYQGRGKDVIVSMRPVGTFLQYSTIDPGDISYPCGFTYVGKDVFFQGEDTQNYQLGIYKMTPDGTITKMTNAITPDGDYASAGSNVISYGGNYYWLGRHRYDYDLWEYEVSTNTVIQLTGKQGDIIRGDDTYDMVLIGSKLYVSAGGPFYRDHVYVADLDEPTFSLRNLTEELASQNSYNWDAQNITEFNGKLLFTSSLDNRDDPNVYQVDPDTGEVSKLFDVDSVEGNTGWVDAMIVMGDKLFMYYGTENNGTQLRKWTSGDSASQMPLPEGFQLNCLAPIGGNLVIQDNNGDAFYYGNGLNPKKIDYDFSGNTGAFCDASFTEHGSYLQLPEYPYDNNGVGFGEEPGYIGPLTPIAVSRLGEPVTEGPSIPLSNDPPSETTPAAPGKPGTPVATAGPGKISLSWTAPTTGGPIATYVVESTPAGAACEIVGTTAECIGVDPGVQYSFKIIATNAGGITYSSASNKVAPAPGGGAPGTPGTPTVVGRDGGATVSWTAPTDGGSVDSYILQSSPAGASCVITGLTADCTGLNNYDVYSFTVIAVNDTDITFSSTSAPVTIGDPATLAPSKPKAPILTPGKLKITATVIPPTSAGVATSYTVYLQGNGSYECVITAPDVSCVFEGLDPWSNYSAYYMAANDNGSNWSDSSQSVYPFADAIPNQPATPKITAGPGNVTVKITPATQGGLPTSYDAVLSPGGATCHIDSPDTTCVVNGLDSTVAYTATVVANNDLGSSDPSETSNEVTPQTLTPGTPAKPSLVAGINKVTVKVTKPTTGGAPTSYLVTLSPGGKTCTVIAPALTCDVTGLDSTVAYTASVVAINADGESAASVNSTAVTPMSNMPGTPGAPTLTAGSSKLTVTVEAPSTGGEVTSYLVTLSPGGKTCTVVSPALTCDVTGLDSTVAYTASVVAINADGQSAASPTSEEVTPLSLTPVTPAAPSLVAGPGKVTVTVTPASTGAAATSYLVTLTPGGKTCVVTAPATTCEVTGLDPEESYTASVVARNADGESSPSEDSAEVTPLALVPGTPGTPTLVAGPGKVTVTVVAPTSGAAATSYLVTLTGTGKSCVVTAPATTCEITGLDPNVSYTAFAVARNAEGNSSASAASSSVTPLIALPGSPAAPTVVIGNGKVTVSAAPSLTGGAASSLTVTATPGGASCVITLPATSCEITGLTNKTPYTFTVTATNSSGSSTASVASAEAIPVDPNADVAPEEGDGGAGPKGIASGGANKFVATNDSTFQLAWDKKTGKLVSRATGIYTGYIEAKITFTKGGKTFNCSAQFGTLKVMPQKTAAQKAAAMKMKTFTGKQFCIDKTKLDPKTLAPKGGMTPTNFKKIKPMNKSAAELSQEKSALAALKGFTGRVDIQVIRYRAWPTTMLNVGDHTGKGGKIPALVRNTKVNLG